MTEREPRYRVGERVEPPDGGEWDASRVRALRRHLGETQRQFADRIGTNQQTVSEWERRARQPRRMARRLLQLVAEQAGFYRVGGEAGPGGGAQP